VKVWNLAMGGCSGVGTAAGEAVCDEVAGGVACGITGAATKDDCVLAVIGFAGWLGREKNTHPSPIAKTTTTPRMIGMFFRVGTESAQMRSRFRSGHAK